MLKKVDTFKSAFTKLEFIESLISFWKTSYGTLPTKKQISIIFAQWAIETGQGTFCWNNNIGNSKAVDVPGQIIEYCVLNGVWEIINGKKIILNPEDPGSWFRSFPTLNLGVQHHFDLLRNKRYAVAWTQIEKESPSGFAHLLKIQGYYTASEADYSKAITAHSNAFMKATLYEQAMAKIQSERFAYEIIEITCPDDMPIIHPFIEFEPRHINIADDKPIEQSFAGKIYNFFFKGKN